MIYNKHLRAIYTSSILVIILRIIASRNIHLKCRLNQFLNMLITWYMWLFICDCEQRSVIVWSLNTLCFNPYENTCNSSVYLRIHTMEKPNLCHQCIYWFRENRLSRIFAITVVCRFHARYAELSFLFL